jgi:periplasmic protein TonB
MKQFFLSVFVIGVIFIIYLKFETSFFENLSMPKFETKDSIADSTEVFNPEVATDSLYTENAGDMQSVVIANETDVATEAVRDAASDAVMDASRSEAQYPGGNEALASYFTNYLKYPEDERKRGVEGTCYVQFVVNADGSISSPIIIKPIKNAPKCNKEALRVIKAMPHEWVPATINGRDVSSVVTLPIKFEIE